VTPGAPFGRGRRRRGDARHRGQGLVEFALILPSFLLILVGMVDFGFLFYSHMTLEYATREGARVGSALAAGNPPTLPCADVDGHVVAAVQRVLQSAGIAVRLDPSDPAKGGVQWIRIYKATTNLDGSGWATANNYNQWTYSAGGGPTVDGTALDFRQGTVNWSACTRANGASPDAIGVAISYNHAWVIPTGPLFGGGNFNLVDKTVMVLNPTYP
jgi:hypothetical protein